MKKVKTLRFWIEGFEEVDKIVEELTLAFDFVKEELVTEEELDELNSFGQEAIKFGDLLMITISNTKFIDEPPIYTYQEMMQEFELDKYFIAFKTKDKFTEDFIKNGDFSKEAIEKNIIPGKWTQIHKIVNIKGPYSVDLFSVVNWNELFDNECYSISLNKV